MWRSIFGTSVGPGSGLALRSAESLSATVLEPASTLLGPRCHAKIIREREPLRPSSRLTKELETAKSNDSNHSALPSTVSVSHSAIDRDLDWFVMKCLEKDREEDTRRRIVWRWISNGT